MLALVTFVLTLGAADPQGPPAEPFDTVVRCRVKKDRDSRVYELRRRAGDEPAWSIAMRSNRAGSAPVVLPLPDAAPSVTEGEMSLRYRTSNGGRDLEWHVSPSRATLTLHANYELEVNIEPDLDPRVELMNTEGRLQDLACDVTP